MVDLGQVNGPPAWLLAGGFSWQLQTVSLTVSGVGASGAGLVTDKETSLEVPAVTNHLERLPQI